MEKQSRHRLFFDGARPRGSASAAQVDVVLELRLFGHAHVLADGRDAEPLQRQVFLVLVGGGLHPTDVRWSGRIHIRPAGAAAVIIKGDRLSRPCMCQSWKGSHVTTGRF